VGIHVTVGQQSEQAETPDNRGTITVALAQPSGIADEESMIEVATSLRSTECAVRLTIAEADMLQSALDPPRP
jgi:hypothetical protein